MALTATATQGFEPLKKTSGEEVYYLPGDPGVTYTRGDRVVMTGGVLTVASAGDDGIGTVQITRTTPGAATGFPNSGDVDPVDEASSGATTCLVPVKLDVGGGEQVYKATFANQFDRGTTSYTAGTRTIVHDGAAFGLDDESIGAILYVYGGTGAGQINVVEDYTTATSSIVCHRAFATPLDTTSTFIVLSGEGAASDGIGFLSRCDGEDGNNLTVANGFDDGGYAVLMDWRQASTFLNNLTLPVIKARELY